MGDGVYLDWYGTKRVLVNSWSLRYGMNTRYWMRTNGRRRRDGGRIERIKRTSTFSELGRLYQARYWVLV